MTMPGKVYSLQIECKDSRGLIVAREAMFRTLAEKDRRALAQRLLVLHRTLQESWDEPEGLLYRVAVFSDTGFNCQGEAAELLLRYRDLRPDDQNVYYMLSRFYQNIDQPERAGAALALAAAGKPR